ncbi:MAG: FeoB-associated Cys-rich membrane protein [Salibacteraceae bacterium]
MVFQHILVGILALCSVFYLGRMLWLTTRSKSCGSACGGCQSTKAMTKKA